MVIIGKIHKWASVVVGLQLLIWLGSGLYFNLMNHHQAAGHSYKTAVKSELNWREAKLVDPKTILQQQPKSTGLSLISLAGAPYYLLNHQRGLYAHFTNTYTLIDARSGAPVSIDAEFAQLLAAASYNGPGQLVSSRLMQPPISDFPRQQNAVWQVNFADDLDTSVYVEAGSGRIVGHSDVHKRLADFALMLHFMDYSQQGSFNNIPMMLFAFATLWLSITGVIWTIFLVRQGKFKPGFGQNRRKMS